MNQQISNLRALAVIFVIILHVAGAEFSTFSPDWLWRDWFDAFSRCCVPIFLMISGSLLITRYEHSFTFLRKRLFRIVPPLLFWGLIYKLWPQFKLIYTSPSVVQLNYFTLLASFHLWYLYAMLGLYLLIPILSKFYLNSSCNEVVFYLGLWFLTLIINQLSGGEQILNLYYLKTFVSYGGYFLLGAFVSQHQTTIFNYSKLIDLSGYVGISILMASITYWSSYQLGHPVDKYFKYYHPLVVLQALFIYSFMLKWQIQSRLLDLIAKNSLGIYCVHIIVLSRTYLIVKKHIPYFPTFEVVEVVIILTLSLLIILLMDNLKVFKRVI